MSYDDYKVPFSTIAIVIVAIVTIIAAGVWVTLVIQLILDQNWIWVGVELGIVVVPLFLAVCFLCLGECWLFSCSIAYALQRRMACCKRHSSDTQDSSNNKTCNSSQTPDSDSLSSDASSSYFRDNV